jgi:hypothetical protein
MSQEPGSLTLNWSGGVGPYQVQMSTNLSNPNWQNLGSTSNSSLTVTPSNNAAFYRIVGQ